MTSTSNYAIVISTPGNSVNGATAQQIALNTNNPFIKIDTQNPAGFKSILLIITTDPPEPSGGATDSYVILYQFAHGYNYTPSMEALFYESSPPPAANAYQQMFLDFGAISEIDPGTNAYLYAVADKANVYIICHKQSFFGNPNVLTGTNMQITTHVFVEDIGV